MPPVTEGQEADSIYRVVLDRPDKLNALNRDLLSALGDTITRLDGTADVLIIEGASDAFSAGADLDEAQTEGEDIGLYQSITSAVGSSTES